MRRKAWLNTALGFAAMIWLWGNVLMASAQTRPEAPAFDVSRVAMQPPPPEGVAVRAGRLFDPRSGTNLTNQMILIQGDRITEVGPADRVRIPQGARVVDLSAATVLPG
jgi:hypothetical protein